MKKLLESARYLLEDYLIINLCKYLIIYYKYLINYYE